MVQATPTTPATGANVLKESANGARITGASHLTIVAVQVRK